MPRFYSLFFTFILLHYVVIIDFLAFFLSAILCLFCFRSNHDASTLIQYKNLDSLDSRYILVYSNTLPVTLCEIKKHYLYNNTRLSKIRSRHFLSLLGAHPHVTLVIIQTYIWSHHYIIEEIFLWVCPHLYHIILLSNCSEYRSGSA